jgi:hypothetical protein
MRLIRLVWPAILVVTLGAVSAAGSEPGSNVDPDRSIRPGSIASDKLASGAAVVGKVCVMPAEGQMGRETFKGREGMSKEAEAWSAQLQEVVEHHLSGMGVTITSIGTSAAGMQADEKLQQTVLQIQEKYDTVDAQMRDRIKDVKKSRYTLGDEVALLPCSANSDALVFVRAWGRVPTKGEKLKSGLIGLLGSTSASLRVTLVDAKSGDVLAYSLLYNAGAKVQTDPEAAYGKQLDKAFKETNIGPNEKPKSRK